MHSAECGQNTQPRSVGHSNESISAAAFSAREREKKAAQIHATFSMERIRRRQEVIRTKHGVPLQYHSMEYPYAVPLNKIESQDIRPTSPVPGLSLLTRPKNGPGSSRHFGKKSAGH